MIEITIFLLKETVKFVLLLILILINSNLRMYLCFWIRPVNRLICFNIICHLERPKLVMQSLNLVGFFGFVMLYWKYLILEYFIYTVVKNAI